MAEMSPCASLLKSENFGWDNGLTVKDAGFLPPHLATSEVLQSTLDVLNRKDPRFQDPRDLSFLKRSKLWDILRACTFKPRNASRLSKDDMIFKIVEVTNTARELIIVHEESNDWARRRYFRSMAQMVHASNGVLYSLGRTIPNQGEPVATTPQTSKPEVVLQKVMFENDTINDATEAMEKHVTGMLNAAVEGVKAEARAVSELHVNEMLEAKSRVLREVREHLRDLRVPQAVTLLNKRTSTTTNIGVQHFKFADLAALTGAGVPVLMVGPAGGGKTEAAKVLAAGMDLEFVPLSLGPQTTQAQVFGYVDANGNTVRTPFRDAYENGGLILLDELDRCNERVSVTLNAGVANGRCSFPDETVPMHEDTRILAAGNTAGQGADRQYVSARQQDAALLDRFAVLNWPWDEGFESALVRGIFNDDAHADAWLEEVRNVRKRVDELKLRHVVSPRASIQGAQCMASGCDKALVRDTILYRGWSAEDRSKVGVS